jgi:hypothetical protein
MSDIELVIERCKALESLLEHKLGAEGRGMHEKVSSVENRLPPDLVKKLRFIGTIRNKVVHEAGYSLQNRDEFIKACDEADAWLGQMSGYERYDSDNQSSYQSYRSSQNKTIPQATIPEHLQIFTARTLFGTKVVKLWTMTGEVAQFREQTRSRTYKDRTTEWVEQKIWLKRHDGTEEFLEFTDFGLQARQGHFLTLLAGSCEGRSKYVAIYNHTSQRYFYKRVLWGQLLLGGFLGSALTGGFSWGAYALISIIGIWLFRGPLFMIIAALVLGVVFVKKIPILPLSQFSSHISSIIASFD